jgi:hypothetical protein
MASQRKSPSSGSTPEAEKPAKKYELNDVQKQVDTHERFISKFDNKLDTIITLLQARPTTEQVDDKIQLAIKDAVEKLDLKYGSIVGTNKWVLRFLVGLGASLLLSMLTIIVGLLGSKS